MDAGILESRFACVHVERQRATSRKSAEGRAADAGDDVVRGVNPLLTPKLRVRCSLNAFGPSCASSVKYKSWLRACSKRSPAARLMSRLLRTASFAACMANGASAASLLAISKASVIRSSRANHPIDETPLESLLGGHRFTEKNEFHRDRMGS